MVVEIILAVVVTSLVWFIGFVYLLRAMIETNTKEVEKEAEEKYHKKFCEEVKGLRERAEDRARENIKKIDEALNDLLKVNQETLGKVLAKFDVENVDELLDLDFAQRKYVWCGLRKLTPEELEEIKTKDFGDLSQREIGEIYGISHSRVGQILQSVKSKKTK